MIVSRTVYCFRSEAGATADLAPLQGDYQFRQLETVDFRASSLGQEKGRAEVFAARLAEGHEAWGYVDDSGETAAYLWLTMAPDATVTANFECGLKAEVPPGTAYIWDCRSHPAHQGMGLYRHGLQALREIACARGARTVLIVSRRENERSVASIEKVGFDRFAVLHLYAFREMVLLRGGGGLNLLRTGAVVRLASGG